jgi:hypothetical protein
MDNPLNVYPLFIPTKSKGPQLSLGALLFLRASFRI